jgi:CheY-like chemotaxis protein
MWWQAADRGRAVVPDNEAGTGVLVVEDDDAMRMLFEEALVLEGYRVRTAGDATAGLAVLREWRPDVVVLDVRLPDLDAPAFRAAQRALPGVADVPVLLVSAARAEDLAALAQHLDAGAWLAKPLELAELQGAVARLAGR